MAWEAFTYTVQPNTTSNYSTPKHYINTLPSHSFSSHKQKHNTHKQSCEDISIDKTNHINYQPEAKGKGKDNKSEKQCQKFPLLDCHCLGSWWSLSSLHWRKLQESLSFWEGSQMFRMFRPTWKFKNLEGMLYILI